MPPTLTQTAQDLIDNFNRPDYDRVLRKMEHDVVLQRVLFTDLVSGIGNVHGYLNFHMFDRNPKLVNLNAIPPFPPFPPYTDPLTQIPANELNALKGQVTFTGQYLDDNNTNPNSTKVSFTLNFVRKNTNENWSLLSSSATIIP